MHRCKHTDKDIKYYMDYSFNSINVLTTGLNLPKILTIFKESLMILFFFFKKSLLQTYCE